MVMSGYKYIYLNAVQWVEAQTYRVSANDLTRVFLGVTADQTNKTNFLGGFKSVPIRYRLA